MAHWQLLGCTPFLELLRANLSKVVPTPQGYLVYSGEEQRPQSPRPPVHSNETTVATSLSTFSHNPTLALCTLISKVSLCHVHLGLFLEPT